MAPQPGQQEQERLEKKESIVNAVDDTIYLVMDIVMMDTNTSVEMLEGSEDMPEDLSTKHRTVSVQTETCNQERFEKIFDGVSQEQSRYFMDILINFASKKDNGNFKNELKMYYKNDEKVFSYEFCTIIQNS